MMKVHTCDVLNCCRRTAGDETREKVDHDDASVLNHQLQNIVGYIARVVAQCVRRRVRENDGSCACFQCVSHSFA